MMRPEAKFKVGQVVILDVTGERHTINAMIFDPCDGWEYHLKGDKKIIFHFEESLKSA